MDFLHELKVKRFDAVAGGGDEEEASVDHCVGKAASLHLR